MGDKPILIPNDNLCPASGYPGGLAPSFISVSVIGINKGPSWYPAVGEPVNGVFQVPYSMCSGFGAVFEGFGIKISVGTLIVICTIRTSTAFLCFLDDVPLADPAVLINEVGTPPGYFGGGVVTADLFLSGSHLPASWQPSSLFGVPAVEPYFAEDLPPTNFDRYTRYACHRDKTNLKIVGSF